MKTARFLFWICLAAVGFGPALSAAAANTDGSATFSVSTAAYSGTYNPNNVAVVWVVDSSNKFIKTLCRHASSQIGYLSRWATARGGYTTVDGTTSATLTSQPQAHTVIWNCRDTNNAVVADGMYYFKVEYTSQNGDGPYLTNGVGFMKSTAAVSTNFANVGSAGGQFSGLTIAYAPIPPDIAVTAMSPSSGIATTTVPVVVTVSNRTGTATISFDMTLSNVTAAATSIGVRTVPVLAGNASTNVTFNWNTAGLTAGVYALKAQLSGLPGETNLANNVRTNLVTLVEGVHDVGVAAISVGAVVPPQVMTNVAVAVSNAGAFAETFGLALSNLTAAQSLGSRTISNLAAGASSNVVFAWNTTNAAIGYHVLQAVANPVAGEILTANNTKQLAVIVANGLETNALIAKGSAWKYLDSGLDISGGPWTQFPANYYDGFWASGPAPFGFGTAGLATLIGTAPVVNPGAILAADVASNATYASSWATGANGGSGFGAWRLGASGSGGHFVGSSTNNAGGSGGIDTGGKAWGLWASSGVTEAVRPLTGGGLATGQILRVAFDNGTVAGGRSVGIAFRNAASNALWELMYSGVAGGAATTNLSENFAGFTTTSGTTDRAASLDTYLQTTGWTGTRIYENAGTAKIGTSSAKGYITTPTRDLSANGGVATLKFDLGKYRNDIGLVQVMHASDGSTFIQVGSDLTPPASLTTQTIPITGGTALSKIQITAKNAVSNRFHLDNVVLTQSGSGGGTTNYLLNDLSGLASTPIPFTGDGLQIAFQLTGPTSYVADVTSGANSWAFSGSLLAQADPVLAQVRCWNYEAGAGSTADAFLNSLSVSFPSVVSTTTNPITTYFRKEFTMDFAPIAVSGLVRRVDGVALYLNGLPLEQQNLPAGAIINAAALASAAVAGANATSYFPFSIAPSNLLVGRNILAAEVHLSAATAPAKAFDLELKALNSVVARIPAVAPTAIQSDGNVQSGDRVGVTVNLSNAGNVATACTVLIRDAATGTILASLAAPLLVAGESGSVHLDWPTLGLPTGTRTLQVATVINGVTNWAGTVSNMVTVAAQNYAPRAVNASGSIGGPCNAVAVSGQTVVLGCGSTLEIWDAQTPANPVRVGMIRMPGLIESLAIGGSTVYVAAGASGVHVVNISTPAAPVHVATFDTSGNAHRLALSGSTLYVADGLGGVRALNVAVPSAPVLTSAYATAGSAHSLLSASPNLVVLDMDEGLQIITAAASPTLLGANRFITAGLGLASVADAVIVSDANGGLFRVATTNLAAPAIAVQTRLPAAGKSLVASGSALYVAAGAVGLLTVNPATLAVVATNATGGDASDVALSGSVLYVATGFGGCQAWNVSSPSAPALLGTFGIGVRAVDADMASNTLFVAGDEAGLQIHSLTNLASPKWVATIATSTNPRCLAVSGSLAFVAEALGGLKIYDISNPAAPSLLGTDPASGLVTVRRLVLSGTHLAMTDGRQINLLDVSDPAVPVQLASNVPPGYVFDLAANTANVFAACGGAGLRILNKSTLGTVGTFLTAPDPIVTVAVNGPYAYVGNGRATFQTLDVANPAAPSLVQSSSGPGFGIASAGSFVYLVGGQNQGKGMDVSAPLTPVSSLNMSNLTLSLRVRASGNVVLVAEDEAGLALFDVSTGDVNHNGIPDVIDQQIVDADPNDAIATIWDVLPGDDFDGDGASNLAESIAGTSPADPVSFFAISAVNDASGGANGQIVVHWFSEPGKTYTVHQSTNLLTGFTTLQAGVAETSPMNSFTTTVATAETYFIISVP
jgi:hypothetical protein